MNCDGCKHYDWYYDHCREWDCEVDAREVHNCFEAYDMPIRDKMVNYEDEMGRNQIVSFQVWLSMQYKPEEWD